MIKSTVTTILYYKFKFIVSYRYHFDYILNLYHKKCIFLCESVCVNYINLSVYIFRYLV